MKEYLKMADVFSLPVNQETLEVYCKEAMKKFEETEEYAAHAINSHDALVAEVDRLHSILQRCCDALYIADKFCGNHTADECDDSIAIPIKDALVESAKELTK